MLLMAVTQIVLAGDFEDGATALIRSDYGTALVKFNRAAQQGNSDAQNNLGFMYLNGMGVAQDYKEAVRWFRMAAAQGNAYSQSHLGRMYRNGWGVAQNYTESVHWYTLAAEQGIAKDRKSVV